MNRQTSVTTGRLAWSVSEVALTTGLSTGFVRNEIRTGKLKARRAGRRLLVLDRDLRLYLGDGETAVGKDETRPAVWRASKLHSPV